EKTHKISKHIREIKAKHGMKNDFEVKWTKVSPAKQDFYFDLIDYFFDDENLHFRSLIIPDKSKLQHDMYDQDHDTWYYKMYFDMLKVILSPNANYRIYLDIKDTQSAAKVAKLHDVLCNNMYDFQREIIERVQTVRSHEVELLQLADLIMGAVSYVNRNVTSSVVKLSLVDKIRKKSHYELTKSTLLMEKKFNLFRWHASGAKR
ncbi:MAG: DUF3800 domain-containing protein, partial [Candidatus Anammoxibacter sp.]